MHRKLVWLIGLPVLLIGSLGVFIFTHSGIGLDRHNLPKFIQHDFVDLSKIYSISKFRSGAGHDFSGAGETCRSMKHYFSPQDSGSKKTQDGLPPKPDGQTDLPIFSPVDGLVIGDSAEHTPIGRQIAIVPDHAQQFKIRLFHVWTVPGFAVGRHVKAGEKIGVIGRYQGTDISVQIGLLPSQEEFVSYFDVMPDQLFADYEARGVSARDDLIISKSYRDAHPLRCGDGSGGKNAKEMFVYPSGYDHSQDEVHLSGYISPTPSSMPANGSMNVPQNYGNNPPAQ